MKYNIEGKIDFFSELYKSLDDEDKTESENNICLITNHILTDKFVELNCGHKFNYIPLYNDIYNHKRKFNNLEGPSTFLKANEIRCPYCRKKHSGVLPYYSDIVSEKINGVNFYDDTVITHKNIYSFGKCEFIMTVPDKNNPDNILNYPCQIHHVTKLDNDNKTYCWTHNKIMIRKFEKENKEKEKEAQKKLKQETKQKEKEEKKKIKEEEKEKKKTDKLIKKKEKSEKNLILSITDIEESNVVVSSLSQSQFQIEIPSENKNISKGCSQIIKTGDNKGNLCGLVILNDCLCKRHYNLKNNNVNKT